MASGEQYRLLSETEIIGIIKDPAYSWRWALVLPDVKGQTLETMSTGDAGGSIQSPGTPRSVKTPVGIALSIDIPPEDLGTETRFGGATSISLPRHEITSVVPVTFYENYKYDLTRYLRAWIREIVDADGKGVNNFGLPSDYKKELTFLGFDITSNTRTVIQITMVDCYPNPPSGLSYSTENGILTVSTEFTADAINYSFTQVPERPAKQHATATAGPFDDLR